MVLVTPSPPKWEDLARPVDMPSQISALEDAEMEDPSLRRSPPLPPLPTRTQGPVAMALP